MKLILTSVILNILVIILLLAIIAFFIMLFVPVSLTAAKIYTYFLDHSTWLDYQKVLNAKQVVLAKDSSELLRTLRAGDRDVVVCEGHCFWGYPDDESESEILLMKYSILVKLYEDAYNRRVRS